MADLAAVPQRVDKDRSLEAVARDGGLNWLVAQRLIEGKLGLSRRACLQEATRSGSEFS